MFQSHCYLYCLEKHTCSSFDRVCSDCQCSPWNMSSSEGLYCRNGEGSYFSVLGYGTV